MEVQKTEEQKPLRVVVTDFDMEFGTLVAFLIKLAMAAIPAGLAIAFVVVLLGSVLRGA